MRDAVGRWTVDPARQALVLHHGWEMPLQFEIKGADRLRQLDMKGKPIQSDLPYELVSDGTLTPTALSLLLAGEMQHMADAARFTECLTGRSYPIAQEGDLVKMENACRKAAREPGAMLFVTLEGEIVPRPKMEGAGLERSVVVRRFINTWPQQKCERAKANASLTNTYWRIIKLGDKSVQATPDRREPYLLLGADGERKRYSATVGCNQLAGVYNLDGESVRMKSTVSTLMACPPPVDGLERKLGAVLAKARRWRIQGSGLEFFDEAGASVALFEAVYL